MPKHTLYFSQVVFDRLDLEPARVEGLSARVNNLCVIALDTMREAAPALPLAEWLALVDISNGYLRVTDRSSAEQVEDFRFSVSESGPECNEKWDINCAALARKLSQMKLIEQFAVMEVCRRYWVRADIREKYDNDRDILEAHGARLSG